MGLKTKAFRGVPERSYAAPVVNARLPTQSAPVRTSTWLLVLVPLCGLAELGAHLAQVRGAVREDDLREARALVGTLEEDDVVVFAPRWLDQTGRAAFADALSPAQGAPTDYQRYARAFEIGVRGAQEPDVAGWMVQWEKQAGPLTVRLRHNRDYEPIRDALFERVGTEKMQVSQSGRDCVLQRSNAQAGAWSPPVPAVRYNCAGGAVGTVVIPDLEYRLRRCVLIPAGPTPTRIRLIDVAFGRALRFAHGLHIEGERTRSGPPIELRVLVQTDSEDGVKDIELGRETHHDGEGWRAFEITTPLAGQIGDLYLEVQSSAAKRPYCVEGFVR